MTDWLARTRYCDWDHPSIRRVSATLVEGANDERDAAVRLFRFVRDHVLYMFGPWGVRASDTLARREGTCTNKANLLVALLRATGIPAGYGILRVNAREYFGNLTPEFFKPLTSSDSTHIYAGVHIGGRRIRCDPSTDWDVAERTAHFCPQTQLIEWDGEHDALDVLDPEHVHVDLGLHPDVDELLAKPPRNAVPPLVEVLNDYVRFIRSHPPFPSADALIAAYVALRKDAGASDR